jgi:hypothetical protein
LGKAASSFSIFTFFKAATAGFGSIFASDYSKYGQAPEPMKIELTAENAAGCFVTSTKLMLCVKWIR